MYKKRELEYKAKLAQSEADVKGAEAIGKGISSIGSAVGAIGSGIGGYMQQSALDKSAMAIGQEEGHPLTSTGFGASRELDQRIAAGQFKDTSMNDYQRSRIDLAIEAENRRRQEGLDRRADAAGRSATKSYTDTVANSQAYQADSAANMAKLYDADTPEAFGVARQRQISLNQGAAKAGIGDDVISNYQVPSDFIPKSNRASYDLYKYQQQFRQGTTNPAEMRQRVEAAETAGAPGFGTGAGQLRPPTYASGLEGFKPPGAIAAPGYPGQVGDTGKIGGKPYKYDGNFWVPTQ
jgi:hypothetical protein